MQPEIRSFVSVRGYPVTQPFGRGNEECEFYEEWELFSTSATFLAMESVNSAPFKRGETKVQIFGKEKCKIHRQFQRY